MILWCTGGPAIGRAVQFPPPFELAVDGDIYVLVDDGPPEDWRYESSRGSLTRCGRGHGSSVFPLTCGQSHAASVHAVLARERRLRHDVRVRVAQLSGAPPGWLRGAGDLSNVREPVRFNVVLLGVVECVVA